MKHFQCFSEKLNTAVASAVRTLHGIITDEITYEYFILVGTRVQENTVHTLHPVLAG